MFPSISRASISAPNDNILMKQSRLARFKKDISGVSPAPFRTSRLIFDAQERSKVDKIWKKLLKEIYRDTQYITLLETPKQYEKRCHPYLYQFRLKQRDIFRLKFSQNWNIFWNIKQTDHQKMKQNYRYVLLKFGISLTRR